MACNYLWTWRQRLAAQYLLVSRWSVGVFYFFNLKLRVIFIIVNWAFFNAQGDFLSFLLGYFIITNYSIQKRA